MSKIVVPALALLLLIPHKASAEDFPNKVVRVVVSTSAGGLQDQLARGLAEGLRERWKQSVIIENRPGVAALVAAESVMHAPPDGYSILATDSSTLVTNIVLRSGLAYDIEKDFTPLVAVIASPNVLTASPNFPGNNLTELVALARQKPGYYNYGSYGAGSVPHVDMEALASLAHIRVNHVPYRGGVQLALALMSDEVSFGFNGITSALPAIRDHRNKALAYGGLSRSSVLPDVPTISESGFPGFESTTWFGWFVPAGTPKAVTDKIIADMGVVITDPAFIAKSVTPFGFELMNLHGAALKRRFEADKKVFADRVRPLNLNLSD